MSQHVQCNCWAGHTAKTRSTWDKTIPKVLFLEYVIYQAATFGSGLIILTWLSEQAEKKRTALTIFSFKMGEKKIYPKALTALRKKQKFWEFLVYYVHLSHDSKWRPYLMNWCINRGSLQNCCQKRSDCSLSVRHHRLIIETMHRRCHGALNWMFQLRNISTSLGANYAEGYERVSEMGRHVATILSVASEKK